MKGVFCQNGIQGSYGSWKVQEFYGGIFRTGKSWKKAAGPGKFWKSVKLK